MEFHREHLMEMDLDGHKCLVNDMRRAHANTPNTISVHKTIYIVAAHIA